MTTRVTVAASGDKYPARVLHQRRSEGGETETLFDALVASGHTIDRYCSTSDTITVTEEYHEAGYPAVVTQAQPDAPDQAVAE